MCPPALRQLLLPLCPVQQQMPSSARWLRGLSKALCLALTTDTSRRLASPARSSEGIISAWFCVGPAQLAGKRREQGAEGPWLQQPALGPLPGQRGSLKAGEEGAASRCAAKHSPSPPARRVPQAGPAAAPQSPATGLLLQLIERGLCKGAGEHISGENEPHVRCGCGLVLPGLRLLWLPVERRCHRRGGTAISRETTLPSPGRHCYIPGGTAISREAPLPSPNTASRGPSTRYPQLLGRLLRGGRRAGAGKAPGAPRLVHAPVVAAGGFLRPGRRQPSRQRWEVTLPEVVAG